MKRKKWVKNEGEVRAVSEGENILVVPVKGRLDTAAAN